MANSVTARFNDDCKVFVSMSDDTTVEKAVIIDAEGNETDIGGGGGLTTGQVMITNSHESTNNIGVVVNMLTTHNGTTIIENVYKELEPNSTSTLTNVVMYNNYASIFPDEAGYEVSGTDIINLFSEAGLYAVKDHTTIIFKN